jgi:pyridine nucleotide-disulfide oxidoreductase family protein
MQASESPVLRDIVLIGGGHSHVVALRMWAMNPLPGARLTLICTDTDTPYSGMLPGYIAGHYTCDDVHIDVRRLAEFAGARYYRDEVVGIDRAARKVICRTRPPVAYDVLSINIGSTPRLGHVPGADIHAVPVKPIRQFNARWLALLERVRGHAGVTTVAVVGAGAGGVELALAIQHRLRRELTAQGRDPDELRMHLLTAGPTILPTHNAAVRRSFESVLKQRGVKLHLDAEVVSVDGNHLQTRRGETLQADEIVWVTQAGGAAWLADTGLALDEAGFVRVRDTLQTETDPLIFAAGDCAAMIGRPLEKAGVFAVRMGPTLAGNLRRTLLGQPLKPYRPQRRWLALISTGDKHAVASRGALCARRLGVALERLDRPSLHAALQRISGNARGRQEIKRADSARRGGERPGHLGHRHALWWLRGQGRAPRCCPGRWRPSSRLTGTTYWWACTRPTTPPSCECRRARPWCIPWTSSAPSSTTPMCSARSPPTTPWATSSPWAPRRRPPPPWPRSPRGSRPRSRTPSSR